MEVARKKKSDLIKKLAFGAGIGVVNGIFGAGGGMLAVPALVYIFGMEQKNAHASALCIMLPLTVVSVTVYAISTKFSLSTLVYVIPSFCVGSFLGALLLSKLNSAWTSRIFAALMLISSVWLMFF